MKRILWLISVLLPLVLSGCFQVKTVVRVNPDGTGTVQETMMLSKKMLEPFAELMSGEGGEKAKPEPINLFEPDKLKAQASSMGEGVTYSTGEKLDSADYTGYSATYAFTDVNKLRLNQNDAMKGGAEGEGKKLPFLFHMAKGKPATLTIEQPPMKPAEKAAEASEPQEAPVQTVAATSNTPQVLSEQEAAMLKGMFSGMKMSLVVEMNAPIVSTNATHRDGNSITLIDMDFGKFIGELPALQKMSRLQTSSFEEAREILKDLPGMKVDLNDKLTVVFGK